MFPALIKQTDVLAASPPPERKSHSTSCFLKLLQHIGGGSNSPMSYLFSLPDHPTGLLIPRERRMPRTRAKVGMPFPGRHPNVQSPVGRQGKGRHYFIAGQESCYKERRRQFSKSEADGFSRPEERTWAGGVGWERKG